jgi:hypothetical protein
MVQIKRGVRNVSFCKGGQNGDIVVVVVVVVVVAEEGGKGGLTVLFIYE